MKSILIIIVIIFCVLISIAVVGCIVENSCYNLAKKIKDRFDLDDDDFQDLLQIIRSE